MNDIDREEFLDLIDHADMCASHVSSYLGLVSEALQVLGTPSEIHRFMAAADLRAAISQALASQHCFEQLSAKARSICETYDWSAD
jgi:hypothetical protein